MKRAMRILTCLLLPVWLAAGCATMKTAADEVAIVKAQVENLAAQVTQVDTEIGELTVGGGVDSITMWILAVGAAIVYPIIWRPIRKRIEEAVNGK